MLALLMTVLQLGFALAEQPPALAALRQLPLPDHLGGEQRVADFVGEPVMVMVVDAKRLRLLRPWELELRDRCRDLAFVRIADRPEDSRATVADIAGKYRERLPEDVVVLIDIQRRWSTDLGLDTSRPNLLLLDAEGRLVRAWWSRYKDELAPEVAAVVDAVVAAP